MKPSNRVFYLPYELYVKFIHEGKLKNHKYCHHTGFYLNNEFRFSLPLTKPPKKVHESYYKFMNLDRHLFFNYGLWRLNDYYDDSLFYVNCWINEDKTKLYVCTSNVYKRGKHRLNKRIEYRVYSIDISIIEALKGKNTKISIFSNKYNYDVYYTQYKTDIDKLTKEISLMFDKKVMIDIIEIKHDINAPCSTYSWEE